MKSIFLSLAAASALLFSSCAEQPDLTYEISLGKVPATAVFKNGDDTTWSVWGASVVKGEDDLYHMFYSRWPKALGWSWAVDSEIAHATSSSPYGPWEFSDVTLHHAVEWSIGMDGVRTTLRYIRSMESITYIIWVIRAMERVCVNYMREGAQLGTPQ